MIDRKLLIVGHWIEPKDPAGRKVYGGLFKIESVGRSNVRASCDVRFSPTGPWHHQEHTIPIAHVVAVHSPESVTKG